MPKHTPFEYSKITDYIYIGTNQCCKTHFKNSLLKKGIQANISMEKERLDTPFGVKYFLWLPVKDRTAPTQKQLLIGARTIKNLVDNKIKLYAHCRLGHGRGPTIVAAYFILQGLSVEQAVKKIKQKRPVIHLEKPQLRALRIFENQNK